MYTIRAALQFAKLQLLNATDVPQLEAEILLMHVLQVTRSYLHTWPERVLDDAQEKIFSAFVARRVQGEPVAYLTGHREFWSLDLVVTPDVLIPRPETELLVELVLKKVSGAKALIADLGTGSGAIALALAQEKPHWQIHAVDVSRAALAIARYNAARLHLERVVFHEGSWCSALPPIRFDAIVSNPPYIAEDDEHLHRGDLRFEPKSALVSGEQGLQDARQIIFDARQYLKPGGFLLLEHGLTQGDAVTTLFEKAGYTLITRHTDLSGLDRVTIATR